MMMPGADDGEFFSFAVGYCGEEEDVRGIID